MVWLELQRSGKKGHTAGCWYGIVLCYFHFPWISDKYSFEKLGQKGTVSQLIRQLTGHELNFVEELHRERRKDRDNEGHRRQSEFCTTLHGY